MANFMATLGNRGVRHDLTVVSAIEGMQIERPEPLTFELQNGDFEEIIRGTRLVTTHSGGTLTSIFRNFPIEVAAKTGTTERTGVIHPPCEVEYVQTYLRRIAPQLTWEEVEAEMNRLMTEFPDRWQNTNTAVRRALLNLDDRLTFELIDAHKPVYDPLAWVVAMAPADDPKIAVAVLVFQGGTSLNAGPIAREIIGDFFQLGRYFEDVSLDSTRM
jgi:penicillin-binding protein 2